jgi:hypothetical protein
MLPMQSAQKIVDGHHHAGPHAVLVVEQAAVILFLVCLALAGAALPYL